MNRQRIMALKRNRGGPGVPDSGEFLDFDNQTGSFFFSSGITAPGSGATARVSSVVDDGTSGTFTLTNIVGTFVDNEMIYGHLIGFNPIYGSELSSGNLTIGVFYQITARTEQDFTADGSPDNNVGTSFLATGTNVTLDADDKVKSITNAALCDGTVY